MQIVRKLNLVLDDLFLPTPTSLKLATVCLAVQSGKKIQRTMLIKLVRFWAGIFGLHVDTLSSCCLQPFPIVDIDVTMGDPHLCLLEFPVCLGVCKMLEQDNCCSRAQSECGTSCQLCSIDS
jgi:hypothetical protein